MKYATIPVEVLSDKIKLDGLKAWFGEDGPFHEIAAIIEHVASGGRLNPLWLNDLLIHYRKKHVSHDVDEYEIWLMNNPTFYAIYELYTNEEWLLANQYADTAPYHYPAAKVEEVLPATESKEAPTQRRLASSGIKGVYRSKDRVWVAQCRLDGKNRNLGVFDTKEEAAEAILEVQWIGWPEYRRRYPPYFRGRKTGQASSSTATSGPAEAGKVRRTDGARNKGGSGKSGVSGITWDTIHNGWKIRLKVDGKVQTFGYRKSLEDAETALSVIKASYGLA